MNDSTQKHNPLTLAAVIVDLEALFNGDVLIIPTQADADRCNAIVADLRAIASVPAPVAPWYSQAFMRGEKYTLAAAEARIRALRVGDSSGPLFDAGFAAAIDAVLAALRDQEKKP